MSVEDICCAPGSENEGVDVESIILCDIVDGEVVGTAIAVYTYDGGVPVGAPTFVVPGTEDEYVVQGVLGPCADPARETVLTEPGCLSGPATADLSSVERCRLDHIYLREERFNVDLPAGWSVRDLITALDALGNNDLVQDGGGGNRVSSTDVALNTLRFVCIDDLILDDFGEGGSNGNRLTNPAGTSTTYAFKPSGSIGDGQYAVTSFGDAGLAAFNTNLGSITQDANGNPNGNAMIVNAAFDPGEFYRRTVTGLAQNGFYTARAHIVATNEARSPIPVNVTIRIEDQSGNILSEIDTGDIAAGTGNNNSWTQYLIVFSNGFSSTVDMVFVNNSPGGGGNDLALDNILFSELQETIIDMAPRSAGLPVEIVKTVDPDGEVSIRVWSADGNTEYIIPDPGGLVLSVGACPESSTSSLPDYCSCWRGIDPSAITAQTLVLGADPAGQADYNVAGGFGFSASINGEGGAESGSIFGSAGGSIGGILIPTGGSATITPTGHNDVWTLAVYDLDTADTITFDIAPVTWTNADPVGGGNGLVFTGIGTELTSQFEFADDVLAIDVSATSGGFLVTSITADVNTGEPGEFYADRCVEASGLITYTRVDTGQVFNDPALIDSLVPCGEPFADTDDPIVQDTLACWNGQTYIRRTTWANNQLTEIYVDADGSTQNQPAFGEATLGPCPCVVVTVGYLLECQTADLTLAMDADATFSDQSQPTSTFSMASGNSALIVSQLEAAQEFQESEEANGLPVTPFVIHTDDGDFSFPPSAFVEYNGSAFVVTTADVSAWPYSGQSTVTDLEYSIFSGCECRTVEMVQRINPDGSGSLISILESNATPSGEKNQIPFPFEFGTTGPFPGLCETDQQVIDLDTLCCNDDLAVNNPGLALRRVAWLDAAKTENMLDAIGGSPIAGNEGDEVWEVRDPVEPFIAPAWTRLGPPSTGTLPPFLELDVTNGLPALHFQPTPVGGPITDGAILGIRRGTLPANDPFTMFELVTFDLAADPQAEDVHLFSAEHSDDEGGSSRTGAWQTLTQAKVDVDGVTRKMLLWRVNRSGGGTTVLGTVTSGHQVNDDTVGQGMKLASHEELLDGRPHLVTVQYDGTTAKGFFDGELRFEVEVVVPLLAETLRFGTNNAHSGLGAVWDLRVNEFLIDDGSFTQDEIATVNAYLICKWGIDPSLVAGGAGDLTLGVDGAYGSPTQYVRITHADGTIVYRDTDSGIIYPVPPVPGLSVCGMTSECCNTHQTIETLICDGTNTMVRRTELVNGEVVGREWLGDDGTSINEPVSWTFGSCATAGAGGGDSDQYELVETTVCADHISAIRQVRTENGVIVSETFIGDDGATIIPTEWRAGPCQTHDWELFNDLVCADGEPAYRRTQTIDGITGTEFFIGTDGNIVVPTEWVPGPCPCASEASGKICYEAVDKVSEWDEIDLANWEIKSDIDGWKINSAYGPRLIELAAVPPYDKSEGPSVGVFTTTDNATFGDVVITRDGGFGDGPISIFLYDIDASELLPGITPTPDFIGATGDGVLTEVTFNDLSDEDEIVINFSGPSGVRLDLVVPLVRKAEAWTFHDCNGVATYVDTATGEDVINPTVIECTVTTSAIEAPCCPVSLGTVCWVDGTESGEAFAIFAPDTEITTYTDTTGGGTIDASLVTDCTYTDNAHIAQANENVPWIAADDIPPGQIVGLSMTVTEGRAVIVDSANHSVPVPLGFTASWAAGEDGILNPPTAIVPQGDSHVIITMTIRS